jgi:predicted dienelactone hydrolase
MAAWQTAGLVLAVLMLVSACAGLQHRQAATPAKHEATGQAVTPPPSPAAVIGAPGHYLVGQRQVIFVEPGHAGRTDPYLGPRTLLTGIWYPLAQRPGEPATGPFPLIVFAPGFMQCGARYSDLLRAWASAGYVVAAVNFPRTDCHVGAAAYEPDLVNQPADMSYALSRLLALSAQAHGVFSGLLNGHEIAAAGQSDGGDTVAALAANACCTDHRLQAVAVLSGAEWPPMPGQYFRHRAPPMMFVQGSADTINPPWTSLQLYRADGSAARYYLDLFGADHTSPYIGTNPVEQLAARVTLAFFNRYVLGQAGALGTMTRDGNVSGTAALVSGGQLPP